MLWAGCSAALTRNDGDDGLACVGGGEHQRRPTAQRRHDRQPAPRVGKRIRFADEEVGGRRVPDLNRYRVDEQPQHQAARHRLPARGRMPDGVADQFGDH